MAVAGRTYQVKAPRGRGAHLRHTVLPGRTPVMAAIMLSAVGVVASYWVVMQLEWTLYANAPTATERVAG